MKELTCQFGNICGGDFFVSLLNNCFCCHPIRKFVLVVFFGPFVQVLPILGPHGPTVVFKEEWPHLRSTQYKSVYLSIYIYINKIPLSKSFLCGSDPLYRIRQNKLKISQISAPTCTRLRSLKYVLIISFKRSLKSIKIIILFYFHSKT